MYSLLPEMRQLKRNLFPASGEIPAIGDGTRLIGKDRLVPKMVRRGQCQVAIRFHLHPDIRVSPAQGGGLLLKLPGGEGWRFRSAGEPAIEESLYVASQTPRRCEQIVITGEVGRETLELAWMFERMSAA